MAKAGCKLEPWQHYITYMLGGGMVAPTPHTGPPVHCPLVENICIIYNNMSIYQKSKRTSPASESWGGHSDKEK
jgi:hypothetical protein